MVSKYASQDGFEGSVKKMKHLLQSEISEPAFRDCWELEAPPCLEFLDAVALRLSHAVPGEITDLSASAKPWGTNRIRIDGTLCETGEPKSYYIEIVWLPASRSFRGNASAWPTPPAPKPKSIEKFIAELDSIQDESELILEGQILDAIQGVNEASRELSKAYPSILRLFERFPDEESAMHNWLIEFLERDGGHEDLLLESIRRAPSVSAILAAFNLVHTATTEKKRSQWLEEMRRVAESPGPSQQASGCAKELLAHHAKKTSIE